ncbi:MAG: bestrophin family protein [Prosthecobacter sp.]
MYVGKDFRLILLWHFARRNFIESLFISTLAVVLYRFAEMRWIAIPFLPIGTIGTAVAFFVGFKNNQAFDRLWEARRLWGGITNVSRSFVAHLKASLPTESKDVREAAYRHLAFINILRLQLRRTIPWATSKQNLHKTFAGERHELEEFGNGLKRILEEHAKMQYFDHLKSLNNPACMLLKVHAEHLARLKREGALDPFEHIELMRLINEFHNLQGGCERIKATPLFRQYSISSHIFVQIFILLLPFGLLKDLSAVVGGPGVWLTIPFSVLISWVFYTMEQTGEFSENPFDNAINDTPISTICRNIEIDVREILGEEKLPPKLQPENNVLL